MYPTGGQGVGRITTQLQSPQHQLPPTAFPAQNLSDTFQSTTTMKYAFTIVTLTAAVMAAPLRDPEPAPQYDAAGKATYGNCIYQICSTGLVLVLNKARDLS